MKRRIVVAGREGTVAPRPRLPGRPLAPFPAPSDSQCPAPEPAGLIRDGWDRDVTLCRELVTTRFGLDLVSGDQVWHPPGESPLCPGAFLTPSCRAQPVPGQGRKVGQEKPRPQTRAEGRGRRLQPRRGSASPGSFHPRLSGGSANITDSSSTPGSRGVPRLALTPVPLGSGCSPVGFSQRFEPLRMKGSRQGRQAQREPPPRGSFPRCHLQRDPQHGGGWAETPK